MPLRQLLFPRCHSVKCGHVLSAHFHPSYERVSPCSRAHCPVSRLITYNVTASFRRPTHSASWMAGEPPRLSFPPFPTSMWDRYDLALSLAFQGADGVKTLSRQVQRALHVHSHGFLPPGSCLVTSLPEEVAGSKGNRFGASSIAVMPTMRYPVDVRWHQDLIYNAMWNLLVEVTRWNEPGVDHGARNTGWKKIERILMTGLATGTGKVSTQRCAEQMMLAVKHFAQGVPEYADWVDVADIISDVNATVRL